jgi:hypothetical protein
MFLDVTGRVGKAWLLGLIALTIGAGVWRAVALERESLFMDEIQQAETARGGRSYENAASVWSWPAWKSLVREAAVQQQPPLDYAVQRFTNQFSSRDGWQRAAACVFGCLTILLSGMLGWRMGGPRVGFFTAFLLAVSPLHMELSRTARPYTIALLLWMLVLAAAWRAWQAGTTRHWVHFGLLATLFLLSRGDLPLFSLGALGLTFAVLRNWRGVAALTVAAILYLPFLAMILRYSSRYLGHSYPGNAGLLAAGFIELAGPSAWLVVPLLILGAIHILKLRGEHRSMVLALLTVALLTALLQCCYFLGFVTWPLLPRYLLYLVFPMAVLAAFGIEALIEAITRPRTVQLAIPAVIALLLLSLTIMRDRAPTKEAWRQASDLLQANGIDSVWMLRTGGLYGTVAHNGLWTPPFYGDWYRPMPSSDPLHSTIVPTTGRKIAIVVWEDDFYDPLQAPLMTAPGFTEHKLFRLDVYLPDGDKSAQERLRACIFILSRQADAAEIGNHLSSVVSELKAQGERTAVGTAG